MCNALLAVEQILKDWEDKAVLAQTARHQYVDIAGLTDTTNDTIFFPYHPHAEEATKQFATKRDNTYGFNFEMIPVQGTVAKIIIRNMNAAYRVLENIKDVILTGYRDDEILRSTVVVACSKPLPNSNLPAAMIAPAIEFENEDITKSENDVDRFYLNWMCVGDVVECHPGKLGNSRKTIPTSLWMFVGFVITDKDTETLYRAKWSRKTKRPVYGIFVRLHSVIAYYQANRGSDDFLENLSSEYFEWGALPWVEFTPSRINWLAAWDSYYPECLKANHKSLAPIAVALYNDVLLGFSGVSLYAWVQTILKAGLQREIAPGVLEKYKFSLVTDSASADDDHSFSGAGNDDNTARRSSLVVSRSSSKRPRINEAVTDSTMAISSRAQPRRRADPSTERSSAAPPSSRGSSNLTPSALDEIERRYREACNQMMVGLMESFREEFNRLNEKIEALAELIQKITPPDEQ